HLVARGVSRADPREDGATRLLVGEQILGLRWSGGGDRGGGLLDQRRARGGCIEPDGGALGVVGAADEQTSRGADEVSSSEVVLVAEGIPGDGEPARAVAACPDVKPVLRRDDRLQPG